MKTQVSDAGCAALASALNGGALQALEDLDLARIPASRHTQFLHCSPPSAASATAASGAPPPPPPPRPHSSPRSSPVARVRLRLRIVPPASSTGMRGSQLRVSKASRRMFDCHIYAILATPTTKEACRFKTCQYSRHCKSIAPTRLGVDWRC